MRVIHPCCAGLDVHKRTVTACRLNLDLTPSTLVQTFKTTTPELLRLLDWLLQEGVTTVAMESTGDYWKPIYNLLEDQLDLLLVNAQHVKNVPGRKTDVQDAQWLAELLAHGLLKPSFIPPKPQRALRDLTRYRTKLVQERTRVIARVQKLLESANIKLASVVSDVFGVSARLMLAALVEGKSTPEEMARLAKGRMRPKIPELEQALTGLVKAHHRFLLAQQLAHVDFLDDQIVQFDQQVQQHLEQMSQQQAAEADKPALDQISTTAQDDGLSWTTAVELLDTIPGVNQRVAEVILAEIGLDMRVFPSDRHLTAWAGLAPGSYQSAGKRLSGRTRKGNRSLRTIMVQAAWAAVRTKGSYLSALYHRLSGRRGKKRAIVAVARSMLVSVYHMLCRREVYQEMGRDVFDERERTSKMKWLKRRLERLGYQVELVPVPTVCLT